MFLNSKLLILIWVEFYFIWFEFNLVSTEYCEIQTEFSFFDFFHSRWYTKISIIRGATINKDIKIGLPQIFIYITLASTMPYLNENVAA